MPEVSALIFDRRYSVPTLRFAEMVPEDALRVHAQSLLAESTWHTAVELMAGDELVLRLERDAAPAPPTAAGSAEAMAEA